MSWKFNPPPGWPSQPEGWQPPPGWTPDPSWPPAPAGWQFWVPADSDAATPASGSGNIHEEPTEVAGIPPVAGSGPAGPSAGSAPASPAPSQPFSGTSGGNFGSAAGGGTAGGGAFSSGSSSAFGSGGAPSSGGGAFGSGGTPSGFGSGGAGGSPPASTPPAGTPMFGRWWVFGILAAVLLLVGCMVGTGVGALTAPDDEPTPAPAPTDDPDRPTPGEPTPAPTDDPEQPPASGSGELAPGQERTGNGPAIISLSLPSNAYHMITFSFEGDGRFQAQLVDDDGEFVQSLGSEFGDFTSTPYVSTRLVELAVLRDTAPAALQVAHADGDWRVHLQDIEEAPMWPDVTSGTGSTVLRVDPEVLDEPLTLDGTYDGSSNFIVWSYTPEQYGASLLFNEIDDYSGESQSPMEPGTFVMEIQARWDGTWTLEPAD